MPNFLKPVLALVISIIIFAGYIYLADVEVQDFIQTRFYNPSVVNSFVKENIIDSDITKEHISDLQEKFGAILNEQAVRNSFVYNQTAEDIYERSRIFGLLQESTAGLQYVQFIDTNGMRIHYSTSPRDIIRQSSGSTSYRNYNEDSSAIPYEILNNSAKSGVKFFMDERQNRIIFPYLFYDAMDVNRGTAFFYVTLTSLAEKLTAEGRIKYNDDISVIGTPPGIILGSPDASKNDILEQVSIIWSEEEQNPEQQNQLDQLRKRIQIRQNVQLKQHITFDAEDSGISYSLISLKHDNGFYFGRLINDSLFSISEPMKLILQLSIFLSFFLTLFFLFNIKPNPVTLVRSRIRHLRDSLFEKLYVNKSGQERLRWILELEQRRDEIRSELKRKLKLSARQETVIDGIIDKSWDELLAVLKSGGNQIITADRIDVPIIKTKKSEDAETLEEIDQAEALEEIDQVEELSEILEEAETVDEIEELDEVESLEELDDVEALEEVLDEAEVIDEADDLEELDIDDDHDEVLEEIEELEEENLIDTALKEVLETEMHHKGLLKHASELKGHKEEKPSHRKGLLARSEPLHKITEPHHKGLLARSETLHKIIEPHRRGRGLLALACIHEHNEHKMNEESDDPFDNFDIVSPFSSMFSSLNEK